MPDDLLQISDLIADGFGLADIEVSDVLQRAPLVSRISMVPSSNGTVHKFTKEIQAPVIGFRAVNAGREHDHGVDQEVTGDLAILDWAWSCDVAVADAWRRGREHFLERETLRHLKAALFGFEKQLINGQLGAAAGGFAGFRDAGTINALADTMVVNAGGVAGDGAIMSSVYALCLGEDDIVGVYKGDSANPLQPGETNKQRLTDGDGKHYTGYVTDGQSWLGLQVASAYSIGRVCNIGTGANKTLTDAHLYELLSRFPEGRTPHAFVMSRRSQEQLRKSRTATSPTGAPAPIVEEVAGVPVLITEAVLNTEAALT
jgi:hypothetical protein